MALLKRMYDWIDLRIGAREIVKKELTGYLLPRNINEWYSLGSVLLVIFALQVLTGMLLMVYYVPDAEKAFKSVTFIMNELPYGWLIRLCHAVGSNMMVAVLMLHLLSTLAMGSYKSPRELNWVTGFILFTLVQGISLTGYLAPWSQLSFWATTVATNSANAIPVVGPFLVEFLRGGKLVGPPTLGRFFAVHAAVLPVVIAAGIGAHLFLLKRTGVSTPPFGAIDTKKP
jgi:ubiquinol-cytochrome c reductase cytochrome b subunit